MLPLSENPYLYRRSDRVSGLREIVAHPNYIILYRVAADRIEVVNVIHARRYFPQRRRPAKPAMPPLKQVESLY